jgi:hypothetical protein
LRKQLPFLVIGTFAGIRRFQRLPDSNSKAIKLIKIIDNKV